MKVIGTAVVIGGERGGQYGESCEPFPFLWVSGTVLVSETQEGNLSGTFRLLMYKSPPEAKKQKNKADNNKNTHKAAPVNLQGKELHDSEKSN